jgi:platelet-activating factor acetylhydrolase
MALSLAAAGALVLLVEHTDRSSSLARFVEADPSTGAPSALPYDASVMDLGYEPATEAYKEARRAQTLIRATNVEDTLGFLEAIEEGSVQSGGARGTHVRMDGLADAQVETLLSTLRGRLAIDRLVLGGHSFGGATALTVCADRVAAQHGAGAVAAQHGADVAGARDERSSDRIRSAQIGACFALDPAVDWMPRRVWTATGYDGVFNDTRCASGGREAATCL